VAAFGDNENVADVCADSSPAIFTRTVTPVAVTAKYGIAAGRAERRACAAPDNQAVTKAVHNK